MIRDAVLMLEKKDREENLQNYQNYRCATASTQVFTNLASSVKLGHSLVPWKWSNWRELFGNLKKL